RGVPQQFPRKLYDLLEAESGGAGSAYVHWSPTGRAFRIANAALFSALILPKHFKTNKLSSFQRNLNLYGFRKGPDSTYCHPYFVRGNEEGLSQLRKRPKAPRAKKQAPRPVTSPVSSPVGKPSPAYLQPIRVISPTTSTCSYTNNSYNCNDPFKARAEAQRKQERLTMLADAMLLMLDGE
ncbi:hypothetical protein ACHAXT_005850, partial [Thalassiosira profunda]